MGSSKRLHLNSGAERAAGPRSLPRTVPPVRPKDLCQAHLLHSLKLPPWGASCQHTKLWVDPNHIQTVAGPEAGWQICSLQGLWVTLWSYPAEGGVGRTGVGIRGEYSGAGHPTVGPRSPGSLSSEVGLEPWPAPREGQRKWLPDLSAPPQVLRSFIAQVQSTAAPVSHPHWVTAWEGHSFSVCSLGQARC